jgi:hypothetical protein
MKLEVLRLFIHKWVSNRRSAKRALRLRTMLEDNLILGTEIRNVAIGQLPFGNMHYRAIADPQTLPALTATSVAARCNNNSSASTARHQSARRRPWEPKQVRSRVLRSRQQQQQNNSALLGQQLFGAATVPVLPFDNARAGLAGAAGSPRLSGRGNTPARLYQEHAFIARGTRHGHSANRVLAVKQQDSRWDRGTWAPLLSLLGSNAGCSSMMKRPLDRVITQPRESRHSRSFLNGCDSCARETEGFANTRRRRGGYENGFREADAVRGAQRLIMKMMSGLALESACEKG